MESGQILWRLSKLSNESTNASAIKIVWILITFAAGVMQPIQAGVNARLGKSIESPIYASMISFVVGAIGLILYAFLTKQLLSFPQSGPALTFGLIVAGQMVMAVIADHFKILVSQQHLFNTWRLLGVVLIIAGVFIIRKF